MRNRLSLIPFLVAAALAPAVVPAAASADYRGVYKECGSGTLTTKFTAKELQQALQNLEGNDADYSDCADTIIRAQNALAKGGTKDGGGTTGGTGGGGTGGGAGGSSGGGSATTGGGDTTTGSGGGSSAAGTTTETAPEPTLSTAGQATDAERVAARAAADAAASSKEALRDAQVPAAAYDLGSGRTTLPVPLLVTLIACVAAACIAGGATGFQALRRRRGR
ncbi:hypothetical protein [Patulibacter sp. SYSU D01012]|uniref:hypothetical protein n=1 Tax=Patulibacter sp. SYSU D01012 TaxID=2817381 RepID=UPI001B314D4A|nr:hypothetical protein [Patulibacter sp. SYSU D01012]